MSFDKKRVSPDPLCEKEIRNVDAQYQSKGISDLANFLEKQSFKSSYPLSFKGAFDGTSKKSNIKSLVDVISHLDFQSQSKLINILAENMASGVFHDKFTKILLKESDKKIPVLARTFASTCDSMDRHKQNIKMNWKCQRPMTEDAFRLQDTVLTKNHKDRLDIVDYNKTVITNLSQ